MNTALKAVYLALGVALMALVCLWAALSFKYGPESVRAAKDTLVHADGLVGESRLAAKNSVTASKEMAEAAQNVNGLVSDLRITNSKAGTLLSTSSRDIDNLSGSIVNRLDSIAVTQAKLDAAIDSVATIPAHVNPALDAVPPVLNSLNLLISDPVIKGTLDNLSLASLNAAHLEDSLNTSVKHVDERWLAPWDGKHPIRHRLGQIGNTTLQVVGVGATLGRDFK